jgi:hypothetical protein
VWSTWCIFYLYLTLSSTPLQSYITKEKLLFIFNYIISLRIQTTVKNYHLPIIEDCDLITVEDYHLDIVKGCSLVTVEVYHLITVEDYYLVVVKIYLYYLILL